jgi:hypothetical protein
MLAFLGRITRRHFGQKKGSMTVCVGNTDAIAD